MSKLVSRFNIMGEDIIVRDNDAMRKYKKYIFIGDSYGVGTGSGEEYGWCNLVPKNMKLPKERYTAICRGGSGFCGGEKTFKQLLEDVTVNDKEVITDIIVFGGYNDHNFQKDAIASAINDFCSYAKVNYPNAVVGIGEIGWSPIENVKVGIANNVIPAYAECGNSGAYYICGAEYIMHDYSKFKNDYIHPTVDGYITLAKYLTSGVLNGCIDFRCSYNNVSLRPVSPASSISSIILNETIEGGMCTLCPANQFTFDITLNNATVKGNSELHFADFDPHFFYPVGAFTPTGMVSGYLTRGNVNYPVYGKVRLEGGAIAFTCMNLDSNGNWVNYTNVTYLSITFPSFALAAKYC